MLQILCITIISLYKMLLLAHAELNLLQGIFQGFLFFVCFLSMFFIHWMHNCFVSHHSFSSLLHSINQLQTTVIPYSVLYDKSHLY